MFQGARKGEFGLSVPELLVVVMGFMMMIALLWDPLTQMLEKYRLESATQSLVAALELGRHRAVATSRDSVAAFNPADGSYFIFQDNNSNRRRDPDEELFASQHLPAGVAFDGTGLWGPPSNPNETVSDPITFSSGCIAFNAQGKLAGGTGTIYLQNRRRDARAISYNISGRLKIYSWQKRKNLWK